MTFIDRLPPMVAFRARLVILEAIIGSLIVILSGLGVMPWWFSIGLILVSAVVTITFLAKYGDEEQRWLRMGLDPETGEALGEWDPEESR